jgi:hypothetical protein
VILWIAFAIVQVSPQEVNQRIEALEPSPGSALQYLLHRESPATRLVICELSVLPAAQQVGMMGALLSFLPQHGPLPPLIKWRVANPL